MTGWWVPSLSSTNSTLPLQAMQFQKRAPTVAFLRGFFDVISRISVSAGGGGF
jgi:hypothetical protein